MSWKVTKLGLLHALRRRRVRACSVWNVGGQVCLHSASGCTDESHAISDVHLMSDCHFLTSSLGSGGFTNRPWIFCTTVFFSPNMVYWSIGLIKLGRCLHAHQLRRPRILLALPAEDRWHETSSHSGSFAPAAGPMERVNGSRSSAKNQQR